MEEPAGSGLEAQVFKSLSHQIRRDIVRFVGERAKASFSEIRNSLLWAAAIFSVSNWQGRLQFQTMVSLTALWFISNLILYRLSR